MSLFTVAEARAYGRGTLSDGGIYTDDAITAAHDRIKALFERVIGVALDETSATDVLDGSGDVDLVLNHYPVISVTSVETRSGSTWTAFTVDELADVVVRPGGRLYRESLGTWTSGYQNIRINYQHGLTDTNTLAEAKQAGLMLITDPAGGLITTDMPSRAMSLSDEFGTFRLATPGLMGSITGLPLVDIWLNDMKSWKRIVVG